MISATTTWPSPAKLNLFLHINGRQPDGYHELQTLFQFLDYSDTLTIRADFSGTISITPHIEGVATVDNLIYKAAMALKRYTHCPMGAHIEINKKLPMGGGIGGGSSNAATTLVALNFLWQLNLTDDELAEIALQLGADVPVFVRGFAAFAEGVGEKLTKAEPLEKWYLVLKPQVSIATADIFAHPDLSRNTPKQSLEALIQGNYVNDCEKIVRLLYPEVDKKLSWLLQYAPSRLTGTGSCVFAEFSTEKAAKAVLDKLPDNVSAFIAQGRNTSPLHETLAEYKHSVLPTFLKTGRNPEVSTVPDMKLFAGNATPELAQRIADRLYISLGDATVSRFSDGEVAVQINENVRGSDVFIIQSTCAPTNDNLMELVVMIDAMRRASAGRITAVIPYFGYARQDRRVRSARVPITAKVVADFLSNVGVDRVLTIDLHAEQIQGFFDVPVDNIFGTPVLLEDMKERDLVDPVVVSPDLGGVVRARATAKALGDIDIAIVDKRRPRANVSEVMHLIGDVEGRDCVIVDDMIDTGGTLCKAAEALKGRGAKRVFAYATHAVFSGNAADNIKNSALDQVIVTDSITLSEKMAKTGKVTQLTLSSMLAEAIRRISNEESISAMFNQ